MSKLMPGFLALLLTFFGATNHAFGQNPVIFSASDTLEGTPGDTIAVDVRLDVSNNQVSFLGAALKASNGLLSFVDFTIGPITPAAGFSLASPEPDSIRMVYFDAGTGPITQNGALVTLRFKVDEQADEGDIADLLFSDISAGDPLSNSLPVQNVPGRFMVPFSPADVMGLKWNDRNGDGIRDADEPGLPEWEINLVTADSTDTLVTMTDAEGKYTFAAIEHGEYIITETLQPNWVQTFPGDPPYYKIALNPGDLADTLDFGNKKLAATSIDENSAAELPTTFALFQNYPNPFNPSTTIKVGIPNQSHVVLEVFDMLGKRIALLLDEEKQAGFYKADFNATNLPSGVYFYKLTAGADFVVLKKMIVVK